MVRNPKDARTSRSIFRSRVFPVFLIASLAVFLVATLPARAEEPRAQRKEAVPTDPLRFGPAKLGLDVMARGETIGDFSLEDFSFTPGDDDSRVLFRVRPSVTASLSEFLDVRIEGQWYAFYDDKDSSLITLYQGYVEGFLPPARKISLRAGRQEFSYGSDFLLGADTFFDGLSFDAVKLTLHPFDGLSVDLFGGRYAEQVSDGIEGKLYGVYGTWAAGEHLALDLFGLRDTGDEGAFHVGGEHEMTYSVGTRISGRIGGRADFELEPVYQFGRKNRDGLSHDHIRAFGGHVDLTVDPALGRFPSQFFLSYAYGSGDEDPDEGTFEEFHNPNNDTALIGDISVIGDLSGVTVGDVSASGLHVLTVGGGVDVTEKCNVSLDAHWFRADEVPAGVSEDIGVEANLILTVALNEKVSVLASANRIFTGDFFRDATGSGKDIDYAYIAAQAAF